MSNYEILTYLLIAGLVYMVLQIAMTVTVLYEIWRHKSLPKFVGIKLNKVTKDALGETK